MQTFMTPPAFRFSPHQDVPPLFEPFANFARQTGIHGQLLLDECAMEQEPARAVMLLAKHYIEQVGKTPETASHIMPLREIAIARQKGSPDPVSNAGAANVEPQTHLSRER